MAYSLVIVESPAKCQKIEKFLGPGYKVLGSFGHITHLSNLKQIDFEDNCKPDFQIIESKQQQINKIKQSIQNAKEIILATDDDREGEAIAWHISQVFKLDINTTKRIIFHEITEKAIKNAMQNPGIINMDLVYAQQGRQILDLIVGFRITPLLWSHIMASKSNTLSAGRCQTPALRLIYDNYKEIKESPGKLSFNTTSYMTSKMVPFLLNHNHESHDDMTNFLEKSKDFNHKLSREKERDTKKNPPQPFTTSTLQQSSNTNLHISPKETMSLAQKLYEGGYITYMRTDSKVYSEEFIEKTVKYIIDIYNDGYVNPDLDNITQNLNRAILEEKDDKKKKKVTKGKKSEDKANLAQEAHEAIRPTNIMLESIPDDEDVFTNKHRRLYKLIWNNTLESIMAPALYKSLTIKVTAPDDLFYKYNTEENYFPGWKIVEGIEEDKFYGFLKNIKESTVIPKKIQCKQTLKDLKSHYTEAKLVQLLEQKGIGRPSTFSSLIEKIQERDYVKRGNVEGKKFDIIDYTLENGEIKKEETQKEFGNEKNKLIITQTGIFVIEFLIKNFDILFEYDYTRIMEDNLDKIAKGNLKYYELCYECDKLIKELINAKSLSRRNSDGNNQDKIYIQIDDKHTYLIGKNGPTVKFTKEDGNIGFYGVKKDIDIDKLKQGKYKLEDIVLTSEDNNKVLGKFKGEDVYLKYGKFGYYLECGELKKSLKTVKLNVPTKNITIEDAISVLDGTTSGDNTLVRKIDNILSIRKGKYGDYIFYKTEKMRKPQFLKLNGFDDDYKSCSIQNIKSWIQEKYQI